MRILQVAPLAERVPPPAYGGTEAIVGLLADGLVQRGHDVVLRASGDSITLAELRSVYPRSLRTATGVESTLPYELVHGAEALCDASDFDIIHNHTGEFLMAFAGLIDVPMLTTTHGILTPDNRFVWDHYNEFYNTISWSQAKGFFGLHSARFAGVVHNAIDVQTFPFRANKKDFLLCLARVSPEKGTHLSIEVARRLSMPLIIAGKVDAVDRAYFEAMVEPQIDGKLVRFFGEADAQEKRDLYARARCLLAPIEWEEPFGLVMPEAMACGTPVVAFARGAAPEIVVDGETGFLVDDVDGMVEAVRHVGEIDPRRCRSYVEKRFDVPVMVDGYFEVYERILETIRGERLITAPFLPSGRRIESKRDIPIGLRVS
ncbi:MAG: glycosyltransferase family 4 protein [Dehalococcoidia bacterium]|jgi:glycosyltransferase involved in cell wall biosynthesis